MHDKFSIIIEYIGIAASYDSVIFPLNFDTIARMSLY
jgi:hypothetical protein